MPVITVKCCLLSFCPLLGWLSSKLVAPSLAVPQAWQCPPQLHEAAGRAVLACILGPSLSQRAMRSAASKKKEKPLWKSKMRLSKGLVQDQLNVPFVCSRSKVTHLPWFDSVAGRSSCPLPMSLPRMLCWCHLVLTRWKAILRLWEDIISLQNVSCGLENSKYCNWCEILGIRVQGLLRK